MGQPLYCSASDAGLWGEAMVMAPCPTHDSAATSCFHGCLAFLHRHFPPQSPPSHPLNLSLHSQQQPLPWDCSTLPKLQLPAAVPSRGPVSLSGVCMAAARTVWFPFHLGCHWSVVSLSALNVSPLTHRQLPWCGDQTPASVPPPAEGRSHPSNTPVFPLASLSYWVLFGSIYSFLLVLLCWYILFCWYSAGTPVCSQLVFSMHFHVWRFIPDVSMERDVLHILLHLCHLVLLHWGFDLHFSNS